MTLPGHDREGERGLAALSLLTVAALLALGIFAVMAIPLTAASDAKAKSRSAADAAALAGADFVRVELREQIVLKGWLGGWGSYSLSGGLAAATSYADRNGATLLSYEPPTAFNGWTAHTVVRGKGVDGKTNTSKATAVFELPECSLDEPDPPDDPPTEPPPGEDPPPPPPDAYSCGGITFTVPADGIPRIDSDILDQLFQHSDAKLID